MSLECAGAGNPVPAVKWYKVESDGTTTEISKTDTNQLEVCRMLVYKYTISPRPPTSKVQGHLNDSTQLYQSYLPEPCLAGAWTLPGPRLREPFPPVILPPPAEL